MSLRASLRDLRLAIGPLSRVDRKARETIRTLVTMLDRRERDRRCARLQRAGLAGERPTDWQLLLAAHHMLVGFLLPSNREFYAAYDRSPWWAQVLRVLDDPRAVMDPIGLGVDEDAIVSHLVQVVHTSAGYDVALLGMFEDGLGALRRQLEQLVAGTHPRQAAIEAIVEREGYHRALLEALDRFERDPQACWRVDTLEVPDGCEERFEQGVELFGTPGRLFAYGRTLPPTPWASLRAWLRGAHPRAPAPP